MHAISTLKYFDKNNLKICEGQIWRKAAKAQLGKKVGDLAA